MTEAIAAYVSANLLSFISFTALVWIGAGVFGMVALNNFRIAGKMK